jgi:hypothetical protein
MASSSVLERMRVLHEEIETLEKAAVTCWQSKSKAVAPTLQAELRAAAYIRRVQTLSAQLTHMYADTDGSKKVELASLSITGPEGMGAFYEKLKDIHAQQARSADTEPTDEFPLRFDETTGLPVVEDKAAVEAAGVASGVLAGPDGAAETVLRSFTAEELYGKYVDMNNFFVEWSNLPGIKDLRAAAAAGESVEDVAAAAQLGDFTHSTLDFTSWLKKLADVHVSLPASVKASRAYRKYISGVVAYVTSFLVRTHPLLDTKDLLADFAEEFVTAWKGAALKGWPTEVSSTSAATDTVDALVGIDHFETAEALGEALGAEGTKTQLRLRGIKAGGTPEERAARLFQIRNLTPDQYPKKLLAAPVVTDASKAATAHKVQTQRKETHYSDLSEAPFICVVIIDPVAYANNHVLQTLGFPHTTMQEVATPAGGMLLSTAPIGSGEHGTVLAAWCEFVFTRVITDLIADIIDNTRRRLERRTTKTREEADNERIAEEEEALYGPPGAVGDASGFDEEEDEAPIYNPKNIPLDWDGKPIPVWLYKLHQLNIEYKCEICNSTYFGRRDFDRHFQEWRHAYGMRSLGIPNSKHFHDITRVEDARALWARLQGQSTTELWKAEADEEFEDSLGNVLNRRTYEDLARHGLL